MLVAGASLIGSLNASAGKLQSGLAGQMGRRYELIDPACPCWYAVPQYLLDLNDMELDNFTMMILQDTGDVVANEGFISHVNVRRRPL
jgi:hypothetical protein